MYLRKLLLLTGVVSLLLTGRAFALGLGDIELNSALNQPLDARVSLLDVGPLDDNQIIVNLASQEDFNRAGLERPFFYNQLRFNVVTESPNGPYLAITTREPVREPYLSFIVEVRWSSGRLLREYTLLLDLPVFADDDGVRPVESASSGVISQPAKTEPVQRAEPSRPAVSATPSRGSAGSTYGPVKSNDTLWEIALQVRPSDASVQQTMLAIQRANPEAFINNNINLLRRGQVLRIPADADIRSLTARQAISEVAVQNRQWSGNAMGAQLDASGRSARVDRSSGEVSGRVRLAGGGNGVADNVATGSGQSGANGQALEEELASTRDELRRAQGESSELRDRVRELEDQIETMESLLEATNEQMRALELAAAAEGDDVGESDTATPAGGDPDSGEAPEMDTTMAGEDAPASDEQTAGDDSVAANDTAAEEASTDEAAITDDRPVNRVVRREPPPKTLMDHLMENLLWVIAGLVALLLLIILLVRRRQGSSVGDDESMDDDDTFPEPGFSMDEDAGALEEDTEEESLALDLDDDDSSQEEAPARAETGDVVGEADIYIRLGKYDQAEEMLQRGLEDEPGSLAIQLKLLELYAESDNLEAFDARYGQLLQSADADTAARARDLRTQFADAPAFEEPAFDTVETSTGTNDMDSAGLDFDLDLDSEDQDSADDDLSLSDFADEDDQQPATDKFDLDDDFTFDIDDELSEPDDENSGPASSDVDLETSSSSDYDLSFDEDDSETAGSDDELLDFDFALDDDADKAETTAETDEDDSFSIDLDSDDELTLETDDTTSRGDVDSDTDEDELTFSLDDDEPASGSSMTDSQSSEESDDSLAFSLDDDEVESSTVASDNLGLDDEEEVPTLDLADDEADDFDLDSAMGDVDIDALDREMSGLDAGAEAPAEAPAASDEDDTFEQALATGDSQEDDLALDDLPTPEESNSAGDDDSLDDDMDFMADADEAATKLDLARAYIDMGDMEGARDILAEVAEEGNDEQRSEAQSLLERVES